MTNSKRTVVTNKCAWKKNCQGYLNICALRKKKFSCLEQYDKYYDFVYRTGTKINMTRFSKK